MKAALGPSMVDGGSIELDGASIDNLSLSNDLGMLYVMYVIIFRCLDV